MLCNRQISQDKLALMTDIMAYRHGGTPSLALLAGTQTTPPSLWLTVTEATPSLALFTGTDAIMFDVGIMINMEIMFQVGLIKFSGCYRADIFEPGM